MVIRNNRQPATTADEQPSRRLWASVVRVAMDDLHSKNGDRTKAETWFASNDVHPGSFVWCCEILDLNPGSVRRAIGRTTEHSRGKYAALLREFNRNGSAQDPAV